MAANDEIKVCLRFRPQSSKEKSNGGKRCINIVPGEQGISTMVSLESLDNDKHVFSFDQILPEQSSQQDVYDHVGKPIVDEFLKGKNGCLLAYGQTGAGKTHTMNGGEGSRGIIPRVFDSIFTFALSAEASVEFSICCSYVEIYNEKIRDLLDVEKSNLNIRKSTTAGRTDIVGSTQVYVTSPDEMNEVMERGNSNRKVAATGMNSGSSRSHSLFLIDLTQANETNGIKLSSRLVLVDLAGSEMVRKTGAKGDRLEEAKSINRSLSALGNVINALTEERARSHVPYRDSKLTRILQENLGGNSITCLILCCSPSSDNDYETLSTLRFGRRAKNIKNKAVINSEASPAEMKSRLIKLEAELAKSQSREKRLGQLLEEALGRFKVLQIAEKGKGSDKHVDAQTLPEETNPNIEAPVLIPPTLPPPQLSNDAPENSSSSDEDEDGNKAQENHTELDEISTGENPLPTSSLIMRDKHKHYEDLERRHEVSLQENERLSTALALANKDKNSMMEKVVKDAERLMSLQMELESAKFSVIKLMEDAPSFLKSKIKDAENKRNLIANNYKNVLQENQELRREVEVLEHLVVKFQSELTRARIELSKSSNEGGSENTTIQGQATVAIETSSTTGHSPPRFKKAVRGGSAIIASPPRKLDSSIPRLDITIKNRQKYEHVIDVDINTEIMWDFKLEAADVGFAVYYNEKPVRAYIRCNSGFGKFKPDDSSDTKVKLVFDNSYSIFRSKHVRLAIQVRLLKGKNADSKKKDGGVEAMHKKNKNSNGPKSSKKTDKMNAGNGRLSPSMQKGERKKKKKARVAMIS